MTTTCLLPIWQNDKTIRRMVVCNYWKNYTASITISDDMLLSDELGNWNAKLSPEANYIMFETEEDRTAFLLRWS